MSPKQLRAFMKRHQLSHDDVAKNGGVSLATVRAWLRPRTSLAHRRITQAREALLRAAVGEAGTSAAAEATSAQDPSLPALAKAA